MNPIAEEIDVRHRCRPMRADYLRSTPTLGPRRAGSQGVGLAGTVALVLGVALGLGGCTDGDDPGDPDGETEVITTVTLTFAPQGGGDAVVAAFDDPDGDGGMSGSADPIGLAVGTTYDLGVAFTNALVDPPEDITAEIEEEPEAHQIFFSGMGVSGPAAGDDADALVMHAYADRESSYGGDTVDDDLPVGLRSTFTTVMAGTGTLEVRLQHLPALNGMPQKTAGLVESLAAGERLPGDVDARVSFALTVQ